MTEAMSVQSGFNENNRRALVMAGERSYSKVKDSGAYLLADDPDEEGDNFQEFWDIAVYLLARQKSSDTVIRTLQKRNKKLKEFQQLDYETLQEIKDLAFRYVETVKKYDGSEEDTIRHIPYFEKDGCLYLTCISRDDRCSYAHLQNGKVVFSTEETDPSGILTVPPELPIHQDRGTTAHIVGIPLTDLLKKAELLSPIELFTRMRDHLYRYLDAPERDYELFVYYALYSWYFPKFRTTPYLRFIGDTGKGKSRFLKVISNLCFYPIRASGASSISGIMRFKERWMGTLQIDESDLRGDQSDKLIKYLNLGFEKENDLIFTDTNELKNVHLFDPFGPKIIAMRQPFLDTATEGRCLSFSPDETTRGDIPPELPAQYAEEVAELRALIARFTLEHWLDISEDSMLSCSGKGIEGRLKQMARPLSVILTLFPDGQERFTEYLNARQKEIKRTRAESSEGMMFNYVLSLALGEENLMVDSEFGKYYYEGKIQVVSSRMVATNFRCSLKTVTRTLNGIGMGNEQKRVQTATGQKNIRAILVPNRKKWVEMMQRYYFDESGEEFFECPECLRGPEYQTWQSGFADNRFNSESCKSTEEISGTALSAGEEGIDDPISRKPSENPEFTSFQEFAAYHGLESDLPLEEYVPVPKECGSDLFCRCRGCGESNKTSQIFWIPHRPYNQVCFKHLNEMKQLFEKENLL